MGCRRQLRVPMILSVAVCGTDNTGHSFLEHVCTRNVSQDGALLEGIKSRIIPGEVVVVRAGRQTGRFRVMWANPRTTGMVAGVSRLPSSNYVEEQELPVAAHDDFVRPRVQVRRESARYRCEVGAELRLKQMPTTLWVTTNNLGENGCSIDIPVALAPSTYLSVGLWINASKVWVQGVVVSSLYGYGTGIRFIGLSREDRKRIREFLESSTAEVVDRRSTQHEDDILCVDRLDEQDPQLV
jgi:hypothetical protein